MTTEFQKNLLRHLLQTPDGNHYFQSLDSDIFDLAIHKIAFDVLSGYFKKYGRLPTPASALQLVDTQINGAEELPDGLAGELQSLFKSFNVPLASNDSEYIRDTLVEFVKDKKTDKLILDYGERKITLDQLSSQLGRVSIIAPGVSIKDSRGFLIQDRQFHFDELIDGAPTFLHDLNTMTTARGFYSPQLVIFMSGPKHFKTGLMIKMAVEYARDGYKVYYADNENSLRAVRTRAKMAILECTYDELRDIGTQDDIEITLDNFHYYMGGDIFIDYNPAGTVSTADVRSRLAQIKEENNGWVPDVIFWDSIDHFLPSDIVDRRKDVRAQIQKVYHEVIALNNELGCFSIAPSQVNRAAVSKITFDMRDVAEDFGKNMNAHAIFAICATPEELENKVRRIVPVVQREGVRYAGVNQCVVYVEEERMVVKEVDKDEYLKDVTDD